MAAPVLAVVPDSHDLAKEQIREKYLAGVKPSDLARSYKIPLPVIKSWIDFESWDIQRADFLVQRSEDVLKRMGIKGKGDLCFAMYTDLLMLQKILSEQMKAKAKAGNITLLKEIMLVMKAMNELDEKIQLRLGLI